MKKLPLMLLVLGGLALPAVAAEYLFEDFDLAATGSVSALPGWAGSGSSVPLIYAATVTEGPAFSGNRRLAFAYTEGIAWGSRALFTNFFSSYSPTLELPVLEVLAWIYVDRTNVPWRVGVEWSSDNYGIYVNGRASDGQIFVTNELSGTAYYTGHRVTTGKYVAVQLSYNRSNGLITCSYNGTNILTEWSSGAPYRYFFDKFSVYRPAGGDASGHLFADDVSVAAFPIATLAWWRLHAPSVADAPTVHRLVLPEATSRFRARAPGLPDTIYDASPSDPLYDGYHNVRNPRFLGATFVSAVEQTAVTGIFSNWTVEAFVRMSDPTHSWCVFDWGTPPVPSTNSDSWIQFYLGPSNAIKGTFRDRFVLDNQSDFYSNLGSFPNDAAWHHLALVKSGSNLLTYVDYRLATTTVLRTRSRIDYSFYEHHAASAGIAINSASVIQSGDALDEVRISREALTTRRMLQFGPPALLTAPAESTFDQWQMNISSIPLFFYDIDMATSLTAQVWTSIGARTATGHITTLYTASTNIGPVFLRARREYPPPP